MLKASIIGGGGYTAGELIRLLINHPNVKLSEVLSESHAGQSINTIHTDLVGQTNHVFTGSLIEIPDVVLICKGHGQTKDWLKKLNLPESVKVIDFSQDFRLKDKAKYAHYQFVYGLPEVSKKQISIANALANPGCFATAILEALLPLAKNNLLHQQIHIHGITGATGAGQKASLTSHFPWRDNNISLYKPFVHQHLNEVGENLNLLTSDNIGKLNFLPMRGNFSRGIFVSAYTHTDLDIKDLTALYQSMYRHEPFVHISEEPIHLKQVVNTNNCLVHLEKHEDYVLITCALDNLLKGASGQAIQNMNLMLGLKEDAGLRLKGSMF